MIRRVYKCLDQRYSLFGLKGSFVKWTLMGIVVLVIVSMFMLLADMGMIGALFLIGGVVVLCFIAVILQARHDEDDWKRILDKRLYPDAITFAPKRDKEFTKADFTGNVGEDANEKARNTFVS